MSNVVIESVPLLPLRDVVVFPHMVVPLFVGRARSVKALELAAQKGSHVLLTTQKDPSEENPSGQDLHQVGTLANIMQLLKLPDGTVKVLVEGTKRVSIDRVEDHDGVFMAMGVVLHEIESVGSEQEALRRSLLSTFDEFAKQHKKIPTELIASLENIASITRFTDTIASHMPIKLEEKQELLLLLI